MPISVKEQGKKIWSPHGKKTSGYNGFTACHSASLGSLSVASSPHPRWPFLILLICVCVFFFNMHSAQPDEDQINIMQV